MDWFVSYLEKFKLVTTGEAVNDDRITVVDERFGCKEELVKFLMTVDTFTVTELDDDTTVLDGINEELGNTLLEVFSDGETKELVLMAILLTVGTPVLNKEIILLSVGAILPDDVSVNVTDDLFREVVLFSWGVNVITGELVRRLLKSSDNDAFPTTVVFGIITKLEDESMEKELENIVDEFEARLLVLELV